YSPLDILRYREYLQFIAGEDRPLRALDNPFTYPVIDNFERKNRSLLDLLGVRYLLLPAGQVPEGKGWTAVERDEAVVVYDFLAGGWWELGPYLVYENEAVFPRAFVVPTAEPLPERPAVLRTLEATDFRKV